MNTLRNNLITIASHYNLNQRQLGELLNVNCQAVNHWFAGRNSIPLERLIKLSKWTGISMDTLCFVEIDFKSKVPKNRIEALKYFSDVTTSKADRIAQRPVKFPNDGIINISVLKNLIFDLGKKIEQL